MTPPDDARALIVTLGLNQTLFHRLDALRREHFPAGLNRLRAHVTMFHHLPGEALASVSGVLRELAGRTSPFDVSLPTVRFLGRGVALDVVAPPLPALRREIAEAFDEVLTPQDRQAYRPHVTVQNKVESDVARALFERLRDDWKPLTGRAESVQLHRYLGGPWELLGVFRFLG